MDNEYLSFLHGHKVMDAARDYTLYPDGYKLPVEA